MTALIIACAIMTTVYSPADVCPYDTELIARVIWNEARGECRNGQLLVAQTVLDRLEDGRWGNTVEAVVTRPHQFSWLRGVPSQQRCYINRPDLWQDILYIAEYTLRGGRYTREYRVLFFRSGVSHDRDWWAPFIFRVGNHAFYGYTIERGAINAIAEDKHTETSTLYSDARNDRVATLSTQHPRARLYLRRTIHEAIQLYERWLAKCSGCWVAIRRNRWEAILQRG